MGVGDGPRITSACHAPQTFPGDEFGSYACLAVRCGCVRADSILESGAADPGKCLRCSVGIGHQPGDDRYSHASRRVAKLRGFMRNRTRPTTKSWTFPIVRNAHESNGE